MMGGLLCPTQAMWNQVPLLDQLMKTEKPNEQGFC